MPVTVAKILERISVLKSRHAVIMGLVDVLKNNYLPNDAGEPEQIFTRSDFGVVPPEHVEDTVHVLIELASSVEDDLRKWGELEIVEDPQPKKGKKNAPEKERAADGSE